MRQPSTIDTLAVNLSGFKKRRHAMTGRNSREVGKMPIQFHKKALESSAERFEHTWVMKSMSVLVRNQAAHLLWRSERQCQSLD
jgi:hypothetical protein